MKSNRAAVAAVVAVALLATGWWLFRRGSAGEPMDLIATFDQAEKRPAAGAFEVRDAQVGDETRRAIVIPPTAGTRLIWKVRAPDDAWLRVWVSVLPEVWEKPGDGVQFRVGVSDGRTYEDLAVQHVNPIANQGDRKWLQVMVDLSAYAGEEIQLILNTDASPPGKPYDAQNDLAAWGAPEIVVR